MFVDYLIPYKNKSQNYLRLKCKTIALLIESTAYLYNLGVKETQKLQNRI